MERDDEELGAGAPGKEDKPAEDVQAGDGAGRDRKAAALAEEAEKRFAERRAREIELDAEKAKVAVSAGRLKETTAIPPVDNMVVQRNQIARKMEAEVAKIRAGTAAATYVLSVDKATGHVTTTMHIEGEMRTLYMTIAALEETKHQIMQHLQNMKMQEQMALQQQVAGLARQ